MLWAIKSYLFGIEYWDDVHFSTNDYMWDDGNNLGPVEIHNYLNRLMYGRRNKFDPLWNSLVLGGVKNGQQYLGVVCTLLPLRYVKFPPLSMFFAIRQPSRVLACFPRVWPMCICFLQD